MFGSSLGYIADNGLQLAPIGSGIYRVERNDDPKAFYKMLRAYYESNGLYDSLSSQAFYLDTWTSPMKPLRNPTHRSVEFFATHLWPGDLEEALPIEADGNDELIAAIQQVYTWSNFGLKKTTLAREFAMLGDMFLKVSSNEGKTRVYLESIDPVFVTAFEEDERGYLQYIRLDIPVEDEDSRDRTHTEIWDKETQERKVWIHDRGDNAGLKFLGSPDIIEDFSAYGIDFIPIVHAKFTDTGSKRGSCSVSHALDKIDEANRMATRLHQLLFRYNKPVWAASANSVDSNGRPLPAPRLSSDTSPTASSGTLDMKDDSMLLLPGMTTVQSLVPSINYSDALAILNAMVDEIEKDLPELAYSAMKDRSDLSGKAIRLMLSDAIDRVREARASAEEALVRVDMMAITIGQFLGLFDKSLGTYIAGNFEHNFKHRDVIPLSESERAEIFRNLVQGEMPWRSAMRIAGYSDDAILQAETDKAQQTNEQSLNLATALMNSQRDFNAGGQGFGG